MFIVKSANLLYSVLSTRFMLMFYVKAKCSEEIAARKQEVNRLDLLIVHSPERAAEERERMEEKVCLLLHVDSEWLN